jgi:hypothetical protein
MNRSGAYSLVTAFLVSVLGCGRSLPDAYGIYANTNHGSIQLKGEGVQLVGNMMSYYSGLAGPSGVECASLKDLIVYEKDVSPASIGLVKLDFLKEGKVSTIFSATPVRVNLWVPNKDQVELDVKPVESRRDMYIISPRSRLEKGFYALYIGRFGGDFGSDGHVYDFVVGSASDYPSYTVALTTRQEEVKRSAPALIEKMNQMLNHGDYQHLEDVYRPGGKILSGEDLQTFTTGNQTWLNTAGRIAKSELIAVVPLDENTARCTVRTTYEKAGVQEETVTIGKIDGKYFVTEIK